MEMPGDESVGQLINQGPRLSEILSPKSLSGRDSISPGIAALSFLSARQEIWNAHCLMLGFARKGITDRSMLKRRLEAHSPSGWLDDVGFRDFVQEALHVPLEDQLATALLLIEKALDRDSLVQAQLDSVKINYCLNRCADNIECLKECLEG